MQRDRERLTHIHAHTQTNKQTNKQTRANLITNNPRAVSVHPKNSVEMVDVGDCFRVHNARRERVEKHIYHTQFQTDTNINKSIM